MKVTKIVNMSRRSFLKTSAIMGGGLVLGCALMAPEPAAAEGIAEAVKVNENDIGAWIRIGEDNSITVVIGSAEMGQGVTTSLSQLVADDLEADWKMISTEFAPPSKDYNNPLYGMQFTGGSGSVRGYWKALSTAGAAAREMLIMAGAARLGVPVAECSAKDSMVVHATSGRKLTYGELALDASKLEPPKNPTLKAKADHKFIGKPVKRLDTSMKTNGTAGFGVDVVLPDMLIGTVRAAPVFGSAIESMNKAAALKVKGVHAVVPVESGVVVVAVNYWQAKKGADALNLVFAKSPNDSVNDASIMADFKKAMGKESVIEESEGDFEKAHAGASKTFDVDYSMPFLAHSTMEPMNCTAHVAGGKCKVWVPTQSPQAVAHTASGISGVSIEKVVVNTTYLGGGFGRRFEMDFVTQAVTAAKVVGKPVKLIWSREEDTQHDFYRPASLSRFRVGLDSSGKIASWNNRIVCPSILMRVFPAWINEGVDFTILEGAKHLPYEMPASRMESVIHNTHVPVGFWRSVGSSHNTFYTESVIDEAAYAAGKDPYQYRRSMMSGHPRFLAALDLVAKKSGWDSPAPSGRYRGIAIAKSFEGIVAQVAEISISDDGEVRVHKVTIAVDCGRTVNPDTVQAQMEGGMVFGLTAALWGECNIENGRVKQSNFHDYRMLKMAEMPVVETHIIQNDEEPGGVGEPGTPPIAPAVTNAIFAARGVRIRSLPISKHDLKKA
ncbi:MAG: xanthine dehydrogenase family protein molybdopterin-binding subunit [Colwellia sp.]|nr:xanthine dehydrogenase family protein molybdopterin-binding subunit [Colwellia sp.]